MCGTPWKQAFLKLFQNRLSYCQTQNMHSLSSSRLREHESGSHRPKLCMEGSNGTCEKITEEDLFKHTRHRWLFNEREELSKRYVRFNLQQLINVAVKASKGAQYCASWYSHYKMFSLTY
ncbi:hypothetical protein MAP00_007142 [Monascus purpureus]|nr:hypothetical protein MAP00_007142 [Monascus purpureus]